MNAILNFMKQVEYKKVIWILAITETIHNLEEAIWLPEWSKTAGMWHLKVGEAEFRVAVLLLTIMFYFVILYFTRKHSSLSKILMSGALVMVLFNVFMPHLIATVFTGRYAPGLLSGMILNVPAILYLLRRGLKEGFFEVRELVIGTIVFAIITFPLLQLLFLVGRFVNYFN